MFFLLSLILCTPVANFIYSNNTLVISGNGGVQQSLINEVITRLIYSIRILPQIEFLDYGCFRQCEYLMHIEIAATVTSIKETFEYNKKLSQIVVSSGSRYFKTDEMGALFSVNNKKLIKFPKNSIKEYQTNRYVEAIGSFCFCGSNLTSIIISENIIKIEPLAFVNSNINFINFTSNSSLESLDGPLFQNVIINRFSFPSSVIKINSNSTNSLFVSCSIGEIKFLENSKLKFVRYFLRSCNIAEVHFPSVHFQDGVLIDCYNLKNISFELESISNISIINCPNIVDIRCSKTEKRDDGVIFGNQFIYIWSNVSSIHITDEINSVYLPHLRSRNIERITVSDNNSYFSAQNSALFNKNKTILYTFCGGIKSAIIPSTVERIERGAGEGFELREIFFEGGNEGLIISERCFMECKSLRSITFSSRITSIERYAFSECGKNNIYIQMNLEETKVKTIGAYCFCNSFIEEIKFPETLHDVQSYSFEGSRINYLSFNGTHKVIFGESVFCNCFLNHTNEICTEKVTIEMFRASDIQEIKLRGTKLISMSAFQGSTLKKITISSEIEYIYENAFNGCEIFEEVIYENPNNSGLEDASGVCKLTKFGYYSFANCTSLKSFVIPKSITSFDPSVIRGDKSLTEIISYSPNFVVVNSALVEKESDTLVAFPPGLERSQADCSVIGPLAFAFCPVLLDVQLNQSVSRINQMAFASCYNLRSVLIPALSNLEKIEKRSFEGCTSLESINLENASRLDSIGPRAFAGCSSLRSVHIPSNSHLEAIEEGSFMDCVSLESINLENANSLYKIGTEAFYGCSKLQRICFKYTKSIGFRAFSGCGSLETLLFGEVDVIGMEAFRGCKGLKNVVMGRSIKEIGHHAFSDCHNLYLFEYCGYSDFSSMDIFSECPSMLYVPLSYYVSFGGCLATRFLDGDCNIPTMVFTQTTMNSARVAASLAVAILSRGGLMRKRRR